MKQIPLTQGKVSIVDDEDFEIVGRFKWYALKDGNHFYAVRNKKPSGTGTIWMHRIIMDCPKGKDVDHINRNGLDNRKGNLRVCTRGENLANTFTYKNNKSGFKGVSWYKKRNLWIAHITTNHKGITLGYFKDKYDAAKAYNESSLKYHKEFSVLNTI